ncbi:MAG TPA: hypothetical protein VMT24_18030 [Aggregatilineaceae bacterium]|jgi:hypothetical protein|nr:hypothetical protein [Aggregatilineaceae bacterium]
MRIILNNLTAIVMDGVPSVNIMMIKIIKINGEWQIGSGTGNQNAGALPMVAPAWSRQMV